MDHKPVDVTHWAPDEDYPVFPVGSKPKRMIRCPDNGVLGCIPGHSYLFKMADGWRRMQVWSEVIAYQVGASVGLQVPPCHLGVDKASHTTGALVEFFYGYPNERISPRLTHASDLMRQVERNGRMRHSVRFNIAVCQIRSIKDPEVWWAQTLTFDALIGNTDRHLDNWGILTLRDDGGHRSNWLSPVFDNGTSLGYELPEAKLDAMLGAPDELDAYIAKGRHNCGWDLADTGEFHVSLCARIAAALPGVRAAMRDVLDFDLESLRDSLSGWCEIDVGLPLTPKRVDFVLRLLSRRRTLLLEAIRV